MKKILLLCTTAVLLLSFDFGSISAAKLGRTGHAKSISSLVEITGNMRSNAEPPKCKKHFKPMDCQELLENGNTESGVYTIWPKSRSSNCQAIEVYCDMETAGGGWTVIQRRGDYGNAQNYFDKAWNEYKTGFGNLKKEFWIGNDNLFAITNQGKYSMRIEVTNKDKKSAFAVYDTFYIDDGSEKYKLHIKQCSGEAGDSIGNHDGKLFYTKDQPNRENGSKEGPMHTGGWWHNTLPSSNLNALNNNGEPHKSILLGMAWFSMGGFSSSIMSSEMKVRCKNH